MAIGDWQLLVEQNYDFNCGNWSECPRQFDSLEFAFEPMTSGLFHWVPENKDDNNWNRINVDDTIFTIAK